MTKLLSGGGLGFGVTKNGQKLQHKGSLAFLRVTAELLLSSYFLVTVRARAVDGPAKSDLPSFR